jgi:hypothetical protein
MRARKKIIRAKDLGLRLTGFSFGGVGVNWEFPPRDRDVVRRFIVFLEDRRALFNPLPMEVEDHVVASVMSIRERCVETIGALSEKSPGSDPIRAIAAACRRFLDEPYRSFDDIGQRHREPRFFQDDAQHYRLRPRSDVAGFFTALGELRAFVGQQLAVLAAQYDIDIKGDLVTIVPPPVEDAL